MHVSNKKPMETHTELIEGVARIIDPAAFVEPEPRRVTQRNPLGKPIAYDRMSDADLERDRRLALEPAEEAVDFVAARLAHVAEARRWGSDRTRQGISPRRRPTTGI